MSEIRLSVQTNLAAFNRTLDRYMRLVSKLPDEVLEKKGRDVDIRIYMGFREHRWKGRNAALREFKDRVRAGRGILVRLRELHDKWKVPLSQKVTNRGVRAGRDKRDYYPTSRWQRLVAQELKRRQAGAGVLAAGFLWYKKRPLTSSGQFFVRNKTGAALGYADKGQGYFSIAGLVPGQAKIDAKYGIVAGALAGAEADMMVYIQRKEEALRAATLGAV